jgi:hypothetical protein
MSTSNSLSPLLGRLSKPEPKNDDLDSKTTMKADSTMAANPTQPSAILQFLLDQRKPKNTQGSDRPQPLCYHAPKVRRHPPHIRPTIPDTLKERRRILRKRFKQRFARHPGTSRTDLRAAGVEVRDFAVDAVARRESSKGIRNKADGGLESVKG